MKLTIVAMAAQAVPLSGVVGHRESREMKITIQKILSIVSFGFVLFTIAAAEETPVYDPLATTSLIEPEILDLDVPDDLRQRNIPIRIYLPLEKRPSPVILFSHGLGGSREGSAYMGRHWASRGYVAVFLQHPGSDTSLWEGRPKGQRMEAMRNAANGKNFILRVQDVTAVLDQLERWNGTDDHVLARKLNLKSVGMAGHSFGAVTAQAVSGQLFANGKAMFTDTRIAAAIAMSPSSPNRGTPEEAFGKVSLPWLLMTGTNDTAAIGHADMKSRLAVFPALPPGHKYEIVLHGAEHSAFTDRALPGDTEPRNPNHHRVILALTTAFWDSYLLNNAAARAWLDGNGPKSVLAKDDAWQMK
ncbi:MAG: dienelactone hydrolase [Planctomycetota bacterium]